MTKTIKNSNLLNFFLRGIYRRITNGFPNQINFFITARCNARCKMCFYWKNIEEKRKKELKLEEIRKISKKMPNFTSLLISGGEPFLRNDIDDVCETFYRNNKVLSIYIPTNGMLPNIIEKKTEHILKKCSSSMVTLAISLDGIEKKHDEIRGVPGIFENVLETFRRLKGLEEKYRNFEINFLFTFQNLNENDVFEVYEFVKHNLKSSNFTILLIRGDVRAHNSKDINIKKYLEFSKKINEEIFKEKMISKSDSIFSDLISARMSLSRKIIYQIYGERRMPLPCLAGKFSIVINENGIVYPCETISKEIGSIRESDYDIKKILKSKKSRDMIKWIENNNCYCTNECYIPISILFTPKGFLLLLKEWIKLKLTVFCH